MKRNSSLISIMSTTTTSKEEGCRNRRCLAGGTRGKKAEKFHDFVWQLLRDEAMFNQPGWQEHIVPAGGVRTEDNGTLQKENLRRQAELTNLSTVSTLNP